MRIAYVSAGAAGMLCGSCLHDNTLAAAIRALGHDIVLIPTYTPMRTDEKDVSLGRVFYGAVGIYLRARFPLYRRMPAILDRLIDRPALLRWVSRWGASTSASDLGDLMLSVLEGEEGPQRGELKRLTGWLRDEFRPDIVHLTNSMFLGLAGPLKRELKVPVVCSVQGEDLFLDGLGESHRERGVALLRRAAEHADAIIATSGDYADRMGRMLAVPAEKVHVVHLGLTLDGHEGGGAPRAGGPFVIGYLARICPEKGLHQLVEAFGLLAGQVGRERIKLVAAGYMGSGDRAYFEGVRARIAGLGLDDRFEHLGELDRNGKLEFLRSLDVMSVPTVYRESKGLPVLEALASGVPVVQPRHGSFPEILERTGGGLLVEPGSAPALAQALRTLMEDPGRRRALGASGREAVRRLHSAGAMAAETLKVYAALLAAPPR